MGRSPKHDPRGYYRVLGVSPDASAEAIKIAYRRRALSLHPDRNDSPNAAAEFHFLTSAYKVLSDSRAREAYHRDALSSFSPGSAARSGSYAGQASATGPGGTVLPPLVVCGTCGNVTAQPRYIIFPKVTGRRRYLNRETVSGVFCRRCADRTALVVALHCWVRGWWSFPKGPFQTALALWTNLLGGIRPNRENHALLMEQARAFKARSQRAIARELAIGALRHAPGKVERQSATRLIAALEDDEPRRRLKNVWRKPGPGFWLQVLVPGVLFFTVAFIGVPWIGGLIGPMPSLPAIGDELRDRLFPSDGIDGRSRSLRSARPSESGPVHAVLSPRLIVRSGPGPGYDVVAVLDRNAFVVVVDTNESGWARIVTPDGEPGYAPRVHLLPLGALGPDGASMRGGAVDQWD